MLFSVRIMAGVRFFGVLPLPLQAQTPSTSKL